MHTHALFGSLGHRVRITRLRREPLFDRREPLFDRPTERQIAVERIMRRRLIGHCIRTHATADQFGQHLRGIAQQGNRFGIASCRVARNPRQCIVNVVRLLIDVARAQAEIDTALPTLDVQRAGTGQTRRQRLRAPHAAQSRSQNPAPTQVTGVVLPPHLDKGLVGALHDALRADIDP